jgi:fatty-acyl-CoA synthase
VTVHGMLAESAERFAQATALTCGESSWTFADLDAAADVMARELVARGVQPGDRVRIRGRGIGFVRVLDLAESKKIHY